MLETPKKEDFDIVKTSKSSEETDRRVLNFQNYIIDILNSVQDQEEFSEEENKDENEDENISQKEIKFPLQFIILNMMIF